MPMAVLPAARGEARPAKKRSRSEGRLCARIAKHSDHHGITVNATLLFSVPLICERTFDS